jgi:hypothetical protein
MRPLYPTAVLDGPEPLYRDSMASYRARTGRTTHPYSPLPQRTSTKNLYQSRQEKAPSRGAAGGQGTPTRALDAGDGESRSVRVTPGKGYYGHAEDVPAQIRAYGDATLKPEGRDPPRSGGSEAGSVRCCRP